MMTKLFLCSKRWEAELKILKNKPLLLIQNSKIKIQNCKSKVKSFLFYF